MAGPQHPLARLILARWTEPSRTGSLIITVFGDAVAPRGGEMAVAALLDLLAEVGIRPGVVRTAISRLAGDGWLEGARQGRLSFYRLTERSRSEFASVERRIYGSPGRDWDGALRLAFPPQGVDRTGLEQAGFAVLAPGVLAGLQDAPDALSASGNPALLRALAARAWGLEKLAALYRGFLDRFAPLSDGAAQLLPDEAMPVRILLLHDWRRIVLRDPGLPSGLLPEAWPGAEARALCIRLYSALAPASEQWLDHTQNRAGPLPKGPDPAERFV